MVPPERLTEMFRAAAREKTRDELIEINALLSTELAILKAQVEELREKLGLNSENSSKPPSTDGPEKPKRAPKTGRGKKGRKKGGQPGHPGHNRQLVPEEKVAAVVDVRPSACGSCGGRLSPSEIVPWRHQVWDLPAMLQMIITEYRLWTGFCPCCHALTRAELPEGVSWSPFGPRLKAAVGLISGYFKLSDRMTREFFQTFFDFNVSVGAIASMRRFVGESLEAPHKEAHEFVQKQAVVHADETGWKEKAKRVWLWAATTLWVTVFLIRPRRWTEAAQELLGKDFAGQLVSDRCGSYRWVDHRQRQLCWAHLLRDFRRIAGREGAPGRLGRRLEKLGAKLFHEWHRLQAGEITRATFRVYGSRIRVPVRRLIERGSRSDHAKTAGTCRELLKSEPMMWTFLRVEGVPPTNNAAERVLRPAVIKRKLSYGTQTDHGSQFVERIMTAVTTLRQQPGRKVIDWLTEACEAHLTNRQAPSLLPAT